MSIHHSWRSLRGSLTWGELKPAIWTGGWVLALFVAALVLARQYATPIQEVVVTHARLGIVVFVITSAVAVLVPLLTNLPLVPLAVLAWGPWWTAALLLLGWVIGASLSFTLGRHARVLILRSFPSVARHDDVDRLIHPQHRMGSLILLRMTFPVDVLSYALGLFSHKTTLAENMISTTLGAAPFAILFAFFPTLSPTTQLLIFAASTLVFVGHVWWVQHGASRN